MTRNADHHDEFKPHTILKHLTLEAYVVMWARKLLGGSRGGSALFIVDACAGAGMDDVGNHGSAVRAARLALDVERQFRESFGREVAVHVIAIEPDHGRFQQLSSHLSRSGERVKALQGTLGDYIDGILQDARHAPVLFFLDPYGLAPIDAQLTAKALTGPQNEVLALFADEAAIRHFGAVMAEIPDVEAEMQRRPLQASLFGEEDEAAQSAAARKKLERRASGATVSKAKAEEILTRALGGTHWREIIEGTPRSERRARFVELYAECLRQRGAKYVLPLAVRNERRRVVYQLVHASKSPYGYTTMKDAIYQALDRAPIDESVAEQMRFDLSSRAPNLARWVQARFAGQQVRWTDSDQGVLGIRTTVLRETLAFPGEELEELKRALAPFRQPGSKALVYQFPESDSTA